MKYLVQKTCPDLTSPALMPGGKFEKEFTLSDYFAGRYGVIFFFPLDFNYISWTELISIQNRLQVFADLQANVIAASCDSHLAHHMWQTLPRDQNGLGPLDFPMIADMTHNVARLFDVLVADAMPEAAVIVVDQDSKVIFQLRHDTAVGRNIDRVLEAIRIYQNSVGEPTAPAEQIMLVEQNAAELKRMGYTIVGQSMECGLDHPQWKMLPRDSQGKIKLSFPFIDSAQEWPKYPGMTIAIREGFNFHSTGLLMPDGQLLFEHHADRQIPRDLHELLRIADATKQHFATGDVVPWERVE